METKSSNVINQYNIGKIISGGSSTYNNNNGVFQNPANNQSEIYDNDFFEGDQSLD